MKRNLVRKLTAILLLLHAANSLFADNYELYSGTITEGDYVIVHTYALKNVISENRFAYASVTVTDGIITNPSANLVWHIAPDGDYWTIYNSSVEKYAGGTSTKNEGALLDEVTDYARWTVTGTSTYDFANKGRAAGSSPSNKWLRRNKSYGFACYSSDTGSPLTLYKKVPDEKETPTLSIANQTVTYGSNFTLDTSGLLCGDITLTPTTTAVAIADGLVLTPQAVGSTVVIVDAAANDTYIAGSTSFILTVTAPAGLSTAKEGGTETVTLNAYGYATFCSLNALDFSEADDYSAWEITDIEGSTITFSQITGSIKGGQGILLKGSAGKTLTIPSRSSSVVLADNLLEGTTAPTYVEGDTYYGLKGDNFVRVAESVVPAGKALVAAGGVSADVKAFTFIFEDDEDGIKDLDNCELVNSSNCQIFNLAGQRVSKTQRGIYIVNGKKRLVVR